MSDHREIEKNILSTFSETANSLGYSPLHGNIIGVLLMKDRPMSLQEIAQETGYSTSMISLSLDLLEVLGVIKKIKKTGDRKLYIKLDGDLLEILKNALTIKLSKSIQNSLTDFSESRKKLSGVSSNADRERVKKKIDILEKELKRLKTYIDILSEVKLP